MSDAEDRLADAEARFDEREEELKEEVDDLNNQIDALEEETDTLKAKLAEATKEQRLAEAKLSRKRDRLSDVRTELDKALDRIGELEDENGHLNERARQRDPIYKRGKLLRDIFDPPRTTSSIGETEFYVDLLATTYVLEPALDCMRPRPAMTGRYKGPAEVLAALLVSKLPSGILLQCRKSSKLWRDCFLAGPSVNGGLLVSIKYVHYFTEEGETVDEPLEVSVDRLRFADFTDEEDFFAKIE